MNKSNKIYNTLQELIEEGMKEVHQKLRQEKISLGQTLIVQQGNQILRLDPQTKQVIEVLETLDK